MLVDSIFVNGTIITMKEDKAAAQAMAVSQGSICAVGTDEEIKSLAHPRCQVTDLRHSTVIPSFIDSHIHLISTVLSKLSVDLQPAKSIDDILQLVEQKSKHLNGLPILYGKGLSKFSIQEKRYPTRAEIDRVAPHIPVLLNSIEYHTVIANTYALSILNIPFISDTILKDQNNDFTGCMVDRGNNIARRKMFEYLRPFLTEDLVLETLQDLIKLGTTTLATIEGGSLFHPSHAEYVLKNKGNWPIDVELFYSTMDTSEILRNNLSRIGGDIFLDGSFQSQNAALYKAYSDDRNAFGSLYFSQEELKNFIRQACDLKLQTAIHAVGPRAIDLLLKCFQESLSQDELKRSRNRIEHFELPLPEHLPIVKQLDLVLAMHPIYELYYEDTEASSMIETRLGKERALQTNPFRQIVEEGIIIAGCTDSDTLPPNPLYGVHAAVNHSNKASRISPWEALRMFTYNGAYSIFQEDQKGTLEAGKTADFVVLSQNILSVPHSEIKNIFVTATYKAGKCLYAKETIPC